MSNYLRWFGIGTRRTPQSQPIPGRAMVRNEAGGYGFALAPMERMKRFLILGSDGGTYYVGEQRLTRENADAIWDVLNGPRAGEAVDMIRDISVSGRAAKNDPAILALAAACSVHDDAVRKQAIGLIPDVCRTGTHLLHFCSFVEEFRGWGRSLRRGVGDWFANQTQDDLAFQAVKYRTRDGWSLRDALRLAHMGAARHQPALRWIVSEPTGDGWSAARTVKRKMSDGSVKKVEYAAIEDLPRILVGFEKMKLAKSATEVAGLVREYRLPREAVPSEHLSSPDVWDALLAHMPPHALLRNLGKMTAVGLLAPFSEATGAAVRKLGDGAALRKRRVHPIDVLSALRVYAQGHGVRTMQRENALSWSPVSNLVDALDAAFYETFTGIEPTGAKILLGVDCSGSMGSGIIAGTPGLTPAEAAAVQAMVVARRERGYQMIAFATRLREIGVTASDSLAEAMRKTALGTGEGTDCSVPIAYAIEKKLCPDGIVILTDGQTWAGKTHPTQAMERLRRTKSPKCKLVEVAMTATRTSIADDVPWSLRVAGFDSNVPAVIGEFLAS